MEVHNIISNFSLFEEQSLETKFINFRMLQAFLKKLPSSFEQRVLGKSFKKKDITLVKWGEGSTKILLWGRMHGDEATATVVLCDLCNFLQNETFEAIHQKLFKKVTLYFIPVLNPDGMALYQRQNAQGIDINRDFINLQSPEAQILKAIATEISPDFAFNLHDQNSLWNAKGSTFPASLSFLAPPPNQKNSHPKNRKKAIKVISSILPYLGRILPKQIGKWDETFEPTAFGDNFQKMGISTLLFEAGGTLNDENKDKIRSYYFTAILLALQSIAGKKYTNADTDLYKKLPKLCKNTYHLILKNLKLEDKIISVGINYVEQVAKDKKSLEKVYSIETIGDLKSNTAAFKIIDANFMHTNKALESATIADFTLFLNDSIMLQFEQGKIING